MRLIKLTIKGIGPYEKKSTISFNHQSGLCAITGQTGSGKTLVLDSIMAALYSKTSGTERQLSALVNSHDRPEITLCWEMGSQQYLVERYPSYEKTKKDGKVTKPPAKAKFYEIIGDEQILLADKQDAVNNSIAEIIGLDSDEFRQCSILPQGQASRALLATPATREKLLGKLFDTRSIQGLQEFIHKNYIDNQRHDEKFAEEITAQLNMCDVSSEHELIDALKRASKRKIDNEALFKKFNVCATTYEQHVKLIEKRNVINDRLNAITKNVTSVSKRIEECSSEHDAHAKIMVNVPTWNKEVTALTELIELSSNIAGYRTDLDKHTSAAEALTAKDKKLRGKLETLEREKEAIIKRREDLPTLYKQLMQLQEIEKQRARYVDLNERQADIEQKQTEAKANYQTAQDKCHQLLEEVQQHKAAFRYIDAANLADGDPCRSCGSTTHPNKAEPPDYEFTYQSLDEAEHCFDECNSKRIILEVEQKSLAEEHKNIKSELDLFAQIDAFATVETDIKQTQTQISKIEVLTLPDAELEKAKRKLGAIDEKLVTTNNNISVSKSRLQDAEANYHQLLSVLPDEVEDHAHARSILVSKIENAQAAFDKSAELLNTLRLDLTSAISERETISVSVLDTKKELEHAESCLKKLMADLNLTDISFDELIELKDHAEQSHVESAAKVALLTNATAAIERARAQKTIDAEALALWERLNDLVFNTLTLHKYALTVYLDKTIYYANQRLASVLDGRFELHRDELGIMIYDNDIERTRPATTLSGGQIFIVSLLYALGSADARKSHRSRTDINSLFIDEGFGSLDNVCLAETIETLTGIAQADDSVVYCITHIQDVIDAIGPKINITKTPDGTIVMSH